MKSAPALKVNKIMLIMAGALLVLSALQILSTNTKKCYYINLSRSVPLGLYRIIPPDDLRAGDLVILDQPQGAHSYQVVAINIPGSGGGWQ